MPLRHKDTKKHKEFLVNLCAFVSLWQKNYGALNSNKNSTNNLCKGEKIE